MQSGISNLNDLEIISVIEDALRASSKLYKVEDGLLMRIDEVVPLERPKEGLGLVIGYSAGSFLTVDRVHHDENGELKREKRIINRLNNQSGQINAALLLELLKLPHMAEISKYTLIADIQEKYFKYSPMGTRDITEALNRMLRKTMRHYFAFKGRYFHKNKFYIKFVELEPHSRYAAVKMHIDAIIPI